VKNHYPQPHYNVVSGSISRKGLGWHFHETDQNDAVVLDETLSECTPTEWATLEGTASQVAFNAAASTIWDSDFDDLPTGAKAEMRTIIDAGLP